MLEKDIQEVLFSQQQLEERVDQIAQEITRDYAGKESPTPSWWATAWTTPSTTAICPTSAS